MHKGLASPNNVKPQEVEVLRAKGSHLEEAR